MNCIVCNKDTKEVWGKKDNYTAVKCRHCGMIWIDPIPTKEELDLFYSNYYQGRVEDVALTDQRKMMYLLDRDWLQQFVQGGSLLDIGCSDGSFLSTFGPAWQRHGIEIGKDAVQQALAKNLHVLQGSEEAALSFGKKFDLITMRGTIEHFRDPRNVIKVASSVLKQGGYFFVTATPDADAFCANLYRGKWNQFEPPAHLYYFNIKTLTTLMEQFGLRKIAQHHFYPETPYANVQKDHLKVLHDMQLISSGRGDEVVKSAAFWGNMMTVLYQKI